MARRKSLTQQRRWLKSPRARCSPGRHFTIHPDLDRRHFTVEVYIARTPRHMREAITYCGFDRHVPVDQGTSAMVLNRTHHPRHKLYLGRVIAYMFFNRRELHKRPSELVAHECGHAAMAWARYRNADLKKMGGTTRWKDRKREGEEILCYSIGELVKQVNRICYAAGAFRLGE